MRRVLDLAEKGRGRTSPNPMVGAVLMKNARIVGHGFHHRAGRPHAEIEALKMAGNKAEGSTLYLNLEPCCHFGKTPPCTEAIIRAGIRKVVFATKDPNPRVNGKGARILRRAGIEIRSGLLKNQAEKLNEAYFKFMQNGRPLVTLVTHQSLDGKGLLCSDSRLRRTLPPEIRFADILLASGQTSRNPWYHPYRQILTKEEALGFLIRLSNRGALSLAVYGTEGIGEQLLRYGLVDKLCWVVKYQLGGRGNALNLDLGIEKLSDALKIRNLEFKSFGNASLLTGFLN